MCRGFGQPAWAEETILDSHQGGEDKIKERESRAPGREREREGLMRGSDTRSRPDRQRAEQSPPGTMARTPFARPRSV